MLESLAAYVADASGFYARRGLCVVAVIAKLAALIAGDNIKLTCLRTKPVIPAWDCCQCAAVNIDKGINVV